MDRLNSLRETISTRMNRLETIPKTVSNLRKPNLILPITNLMSLQGKSAIWVSPLKSLISLSYPTNQTLVEAWLTSWVTKHRGLKLNQLLTRSNSSSLTRLRQSILFRRSIDKKRKTITTKLYRSARLNLTSRLKSINKIYSKRNKRWSVLSRLKN